MKSLHTSVVISVLVASNVLAQQKTDLLSEFKASEHAVSGEWKLGDKGLQVSASKGAIARLPGTDKLPDDYRLEIEFTRNSEGNVGFIIPVGGVSPVVELSAWDGAAHGMARVDGLTARDAENSTSVRPGTLEDERRYKVELQVSGGRAKPRVIAKLEGKQLFDWSGTITQLQEHRAYKLPPSGGIGLVAGDCEVVFHTVSLVAKKKKPEPQPDSQEAKPGSLAALGSAGSRGWTPFNGARFLPGSETAKESVKSDTSAGSGDRGAYLDGVEFVTGTIEVDLRGSARPQGSFLGVAFGGIDGETYESVYFRPFNFGSKDPVRRRHAVQYIAHPEWPWKRLREEKTDQFESVANPEPAPDDWFHARIVVSEKRVSVYVDEAKTPSLEVDRLSTKRGSRVGLWFNGEAEFANLEIESGK